jgi:chemotaxis protein CheZ
MNTSPQAEAEKLKDRAYSRKEVVEIIRSALEKIDSTAEPTATLHKELNALISYINNMRTELAQLRSIEISHNHIPAASDELDAVVEETAKATGTIMDACEKIEKIAGTLDAPVSTELSSAVTSVYEACSFQDITGQRINKVVKTLKNIEAKVTEIIAAISQGPAAPKSPKEEKSLLNGPQLKGGGSTQEEIDKLLASFD